MNDSQKIVYNFVHPDCLIDLTYHSRKWNEIENTKGTQINVKFMKISIPRMIQLYEQFFKYSNLQAQFYSVFGL
ncbi:unnamed protein product [Paramecium octaurelia]|uniref:Uncharacterized protein n=1 Tax=Paramecium octaurelia TaxID=43137 RepID=A0A8S1UBW8_PAROT|nr:unnamed protein product [Paramecium octaurelia]